MDINFEDDLFDPAVENEYRRNCPGLIHGLAFAGKLSANGFPFAWEIYTAGEINNVLNDPLAVFCWGLLDAYEQGSGRPRSHYSSKRELETAPVKDNAFLSSLQYEMNDRLMKSKTDTVIQECVCKYRRQFLQAISDRRITVSLESVAQLGEMLKDHRIVNMESLGELSIEFSGSNGSAAIRLRSMFADFSDTQWEDRNFILGSLHSGHGKQHELDRESLDQQKVFFYFNQMQARAPATPTLEQLKKAFTIVDEHNAKEDKKFSLGQIAKKVLLKGSNSDRV